MQYKRIMALDYGEVRIGIAFSDLLQIISSPFETYKTKSTELDLKYLIDLAKSKDVETIVIGLPLNMDGSEGERALKTKAFGSQLNHLSGINVVYQDERLSSVEAEEILIDAKVRREKRKQIIDKLAAQIILESYLRNKK